MVKPGLFSQIGLYLIQFLIEKLQKLLIEFHNDLLLILCNKKLNKTKKKQTKQLNLIQNYVSNHEKVIGHHLIHHQEIWPMFKVMVH